MKLRLRTFAGAPALGLAIAMLALLAPATAFAGAAGSQIRFGNGEFDGLVPGSNCISGSSAPNANVILTWRDSDGTIKEKTSVPSGSFGYWSYCAAVTTLTAGDSLKANDGQTNRTFTMPLVTVKVDRVANEFRGRAPAHSDLTLSSHVGRFSDYYASNEVTSNAQGRWRYDEDSDIPGGSDAYLDWSNDFGDSVTAFGVAPEIDVTVGSAEFTGYVNPRQQIHLKLRDGSTNAVKGVATTTADEWGFVQAKFRNAGGNGVPVSVGDRIVAHAVAADLDWIVPDSDATADVAADTVSGSCADEGNLSETAIVMVRRTGHIRGFAVVWVDPAGHFEVDFGEDDAPFYNSANIKHGDKIVVQCVLDTGDTVTQTFLVP